MYADELTESMEKAITETNRRRQIQMEYNKQHDNYACKTGAAGRRRKCR